ncbi:SDR family NAD(P)-dependent oxidoreductase [Novosphingobium sp. NDB2Meth1]|uniref:SDR family NAD(P)-dependent oxidoreductase n=1 Tax=Novosphingobium sp. NDB2Meth1 TaxID=1892847 RepID=UPI0009310992|nr:SDR family NAD(P)-dependent oxidoreductase [Novosphingobium sp. NDB2Meth1]
MRIVMTGATAGFGLYAAERLVEAGATLTIGARNPAALPPTLQGRVSALPLDLDALANVRQFAAALGEGPIDVLVLNAGLQLAKPARSADGFERTFAVNHLAHYLLLRLLAPRLTTGARVIFTGSGTHDPAEKTPVTPPVHADAMRLARPETDPTAEKGVRQACFRAYSTSKLCNIMTAREAAKRLSGIDVLGFDPGYVPHTGLGRDNGQVIAALVSYILPLLMKRDRSSTIPRSGQFLADLALSPRYAGARGDYWSVRGPALIRIEPSTLARDDAACTRLWDDSARLVGL